MAIEISRTGIVRDFAVGWVVNILRPRIGCPFHRSGEMKDGELTGKGIRRTFLRHFGNSNKNNRGEIRNLLISSRGAVGDGEILAVAISSDMRT